MTKSYLATSSLVTLMCASLAFLITANATDIAVKPQGRITKNIRFVVDVSGSMSSQRIDAAIANMLSIAEQPIDEMQVALITFDQEHSVWPGHPHGGYKPVPPGWAQLPDLDITGPNGELSTFIHDHIRDGNTFPQSAIHAAIDDRRDLTVVLITDGELGQSNLGIPGPHNEPPADPLSEISALQAARLNQNLAPALIILYSVIEKSKQDINVDTWMTRKATALGGGYFRYEAPVERPDSFEAPEVAPGPGD